MNKYESVIIMKPNLTEEEKNNKLDKYKKMFEGFSKKDVEVEDLGLKKLAYEMKGNKEGNYAIFKFYSNPENISEVERNYRIDDDVMKFITVKEEEECEEYETEEDEEMEV